MFAQSALTMLLWLAPPCSAAPDAPVTTFPQSDGSEDDFPALGLSAEGTLWLAWVSFDDFADRVLVSRQGLDGWTEPEVVSPAPGDYHTPAVAAGGDGTTWVVWPANRAGNWDLVGRHYTGGKWSGLRQLTDAPHNDFNVKLAASPDGTVWMAWQTVADAQYEVRLARLTPEGLRDMVNVSADPGNDWEPDLCCAPNGTVYVAWDTYRNGSYDIYLRELAGGALGPPVPVAATDRYEAHASVACDPEGRCWIAWDEANASWGLHARGTLRLHAQRNLNMRVHGPGGLQSCPEVMAGIPPALRPFCELPKLAFDGQGDAWLVFRHLHDVNRKQRADAKAAGKPQPQTRGIWNFYVTRWDGEQWAEPSLLPASNGRNDQRPALARAGDGKLWVAYGEDGRLPNRAEEWLLHRVHVAELVATQSAGPPPVSPMGPVEPFVRTLEPRLNRQVSAGGATCELLFGDTHRHTDLSRCAMNYDGSLIDTYRYAIDAAQLDFLAISDHDQDIQRHRYHREPYKLKNYGWWRSQKYADLFTLADRFLGVYGYEHGGSYRDRGGHKNILYAQRGMPCFEEDSPEELFRVLEGTEAVAIPHQLADGGSRCDWDKWSPVYERVAEIFQARGSYEYQGTPRIAQVQTAGSFLWDAYAKDVRIGIIASSDHGLTHGAYAGVYATARTRQAILAALKARRTYGSTEVIQVEVRAGDHWMGEELPAGTPPRFQVTILGVKPLKEVTVVKNGTFVYRNEPHELELSFEFVDSEAGAGPAYYYVRAQQEDNEIAWSSPIWIGGT